MASSNCVISLLITSTISSSISMISVEVGMARLWAVAGGRMVGVMAWENASISTSIKCFNILYEALVTSELM